MFIRACKAFVGLLLAGLVVTETAHAQSTDKSLNNGFTESPMCPIKASHWTKPFSHTPARLLTNRARTLGVENMMVLNWYYAGGQAIYDTGDLQKGVFRNCFTSGVETCGIKKNNKVAKLLLTGYLAPKDRQKLLKFFASPPTDEAIAAASKELGRCFGDHPAQPSMEELGFVQIDLTPDLCEQVLDNVDQVRFGAFYNYYEPKQSCGPGTWLPKETAVRLTGLKKKDPEPELTVAQRIKGLNGCQIAYGLIMNGINNSAVSKIPDSGISWALKYETARINNDDCPLMPEALSKWVQAQPLEKFERAEDPFEAYKKRMPIGGNLERWTSYVTTVMAHFETPWNTQQTVPPAQCASFISWLQDKGRFSASEKREDWAFLMDASKEIATQTGSNAGRAVCAKAPVVMISEFYRESKERAQKSAIQAIEDQRRRDAELRQKADYDAAWRELIRWKPSYRPSTELRCYRRDDTSEICFTN